MIFGVFPAEQIMLDKRRDSQSSVLKPVACSMWNMTEQHSWQALIRRNRHREAKALEVHTFLTETWAKVDKREGETEERKMLLITRLLAPAVISVWHVCFHWDMQRTWAFCHFSLLWLLLSSGWLTDDKEDKDECWEEENADGVQITGCRCWLRLYRLLNGELCCSLCRSELILPSVCLSPLRLSLLRLGVSQRVPGVCCVRSVCCLAGRSVWRLHLVPAQNGKFNCIPTPWSVHVWHMPQCVSNNILVIPTAADQRKTWMLKDAHEFLHFYDMLQW